MLARIEYKNKHRAFRQWKFNCELVEWRLNQSLMHAGMPLRHSEVAGGSASVRDRLADLI